MEDLDIHDVIIAEGARLDQIANSLGLARRQEAYLHYRFDGTNSEFVFALDTRDDQTLVEFRDGSTGWILTQAIELLGLETDSEFRSRVVYLSGKILMDHQEDTVIKHIDIVEELPWDLL